MHRKKINIQNLILALVLSVASLTSFAEELVIDVYKSPYCGCCKDWESHLRENGFKVISHLREDLSSIKSRYGINQEIASCHTGVIGNYFIEGHVPVADIKKLLTEKPDIKGLTVPGMPAGENVPGMETRPGNANFDVLAVEKDGVNVYSHYE